MFPEPSPKLLRLQKRCLLGIVFGFLGYLLCLLSVGPYHAAVQNGRLDFLPQPVREKFYLPALPIFKIPGLRTWYYSYLDWWHHDPNEADPETGSY